MLLSQERVWTSLCKDKLSDEMRAQIQTRLADTIHGFNVMKDPNYASQLDDLRREVSSLRDIITELVLMIDLQNLGIDPKEIFLPGLKIGR